MPQTNSIQSNGAEKPLTSAQLAEHLQVSTRTLATYRAKNLIPYWRINARNIRYRLSDVEAALAG
jgi:DNA-binding transcriptional MerR regulator